MPHGSHPAHGCPHWLDGPAWHHVDTHDGYAELPESEMHRKSKKVASLSLRCVSFTLSCAALSHSELIEHFAQCLLLLWWKLRHQLAQELLNTLKPLGRATCCACATWAARNRCVRTRTSGSCSAHAGCPTHAGCSTRARLSVHSVLNECDQKL